VRHFALIFETLRNALNVTTKPHMHSRIFPVYRVRNNINGHAWLPVVPPMREPQLALSFRKSTVLVFFVPVTLKHGAVYVSDNLVEKHLQILMTG
jgi:hypothetical protein